MNGEETNLARKVLSSSNKDFQVVLWHSKQRPKCCTHTHTHTHTHTKKRKKIAYNSEDCHVMSVSVSHDDGEKRREEKRREEKGKEKNE